MDSDRRRIVTWIASQVMPHEGGVRAWLRRALVSPDDVDDLIQEAYCRLAALDSVDHIERPGAYFFQTARMLLIEQARRARVVRVDLVAEIDALPAVSEDPSPETITGARRQLAKIERLVEGLPERCRRIFELRKIYGMSQREIARLLDVSESVVENDGVKGMRIIMKALREESSPDNNQRRLGDEPAQVRR